MGKTKVALMPAQTRGPAVRSISVADKYGTVLHVSATHTGYSVERYNMPREPENPSDPVRAQPDLLDCPLAGRYGVPT